MSEDAFLKALEKNQQRKEAEEAARQSGGFEYGDNFFDAKKMNIQTGKESVFRIVGKPYEIRTEPTDVKLVFHSQILNDKGGYSHIFWPTVKNDEGLPEVDKDWVLWKLYEKVTEGKWEEFTEEQKAARTDDKKGEKKYYHKDTKSFEWVNENKAPNKPFPPKFRPKSRIVMNIIDRHDSWCKENKKTKLPFTSLGYSETDKNVEFINDVGLPLSAYNAIMESVVAFTKHWDLDIVLKRNKDINNAYVIRDISEKKISEASKAIGTDEPLTDKEKEYEKWDLDVLFRDTSYSKLLRVLGGKIKLVDAELGTDFHSLVKAKAEEEKKAFKETKKEEPKQVESKEVEKDLFEEEIDTTPVEVPQEEVIKEEVKEEKPTTRERTRVQEEPKGDPMEFIEKLPKYHILDDLDKDDIKSHIIGVKDNTPVWTDSGLDIIPCDNKDCKWPGTDKRTDWPNSVLHCGVCGLEYKQA